ncbi:C40 family peptidase [Paenibacillus aurantiacus]|uniref:C40 family peptidase n=1 Tax=Paenibacillus aurantiacus TaxID=1936118 RepID=A0ABV5KNK3_9BACL
MMTSKRLALAGTALLLALAASGCAGSNQKNPSGAENGKNTAKNETRAQQTGKERPILQGGNQAQGNNRTSGGQMKAKSSEAQPSKLQVNDNEARIGIRQVEGKPYVSLRDLLGPLGYQMRLSDDGREVLIGGTDPLYKVGLDSTKAERDGEAIMLAEPTKRQGDDVLIPESALGDLFQEDIRFTKEGGKDIKLSPLSEDRGTVRDLEKGDVSEEPGGQGQSEAKSGGGLAIIEGDEASGSGGMKMQAVGLPNIDIDALIQTAMKYRGVPYLFGAGPYSKTKRFDCSSFTQYVFAKYGVNLRRVSYSQATQGIYVGKANLQRGDLVFFSVPGRFSSDKKVGHVGIYIGSGKMIHTFSTASGGVHISSINTGAWVKRYLRARRVAT